MLRNKNKRGAEAVKTAQHSIPFIECYENGIFQTAENTYALVYEFENIDYIMIRDNERQAKYDGYVRFLNALPTDMHYQELIINDSINVETLRKNLVPQGDGSACAKDYQEVMEQVVAKSLDSIADKRLFGVLSYKPSGRLDSPQVLFKYFTEIGNYLNDLGSKTKQLTAREVMELLYSQYHRFENVNNFVMPQNPFSKGTNIKDYIAPSMFDFQPKKIVIGDSFTRIMFVKLFDRQLGDEFISDLLDNSYRIAVSKHIERLFKTDALENVRREIFSIQDKVQTRKEKNHKTGQDFVPFRYTDKLKELEKMQQKLADTNNELFNIGIYISVSARTEDELEELTKFVKQKALKHQVVLDVLTGQQEKGLNTVLPFGVNYLAGPNNNTCTALLSDAVGIMTPFSSINHFAKGGIYYGINQITGAPILIDRTKEANANAFVVGFSGSGKSMFEKSEIYDIYYKYTQPRGDEIIIIDPDNEYRHLITPSERSHNQPVLDGEIIKIAPDSPTHLNIFDTTLETADGISAVSAKTEFIMTFIETAMGIPLTAQQKSIISRCIKTVYFDFEKSGGDEKYLPTLIDFYNLLKKQTEPEARDVATALEIYVNGSFDIFAHKTNISMSKKLIIFDISDMGEQLRSVALQVILEYTWQRVVKNKKRGIRTWVNTDEFSVMFKDNGNQTYRSGEFFCNVYKRIRKQIAGATGITQNMSELLDSKTACSMLANAEFVVLLQQKPSDLERIIKLFELSPAQARYLQSSHKGEGLIICGRQVIPFSKMIPEDSMIYRVCRTDDEKKKEA